MLVSVSSSTHEITRQRLSLQVAFAESGRGGLVLAEGRSKAHLALRAAKDKMRKQASGQNRVLVSFCRVSFLLAAMGPGTGSRIGCKVCDLFQRPTGKSSTASSMAPQAKLQCERYRPRAT